MKVIELYQELQEIIAAGGAHKEIILQKDAEGNGYRPMVGVDTGFYDLDERECFDQESLEDWYPEEDDRPENLEEVIILWPC